MTLILTTYPKPNSNLNPNPNPHPYAYPYLNPNPKPYILHANPQGNPKETFCYLFLGY